MPPLGVAVRGILSKGDTRAAWVFRNVPISVWNSAASFLTVGENAKLATVLRLPVSKAAESAGVPATSEHRLAVAEWFRRGDVALTKRGWEGVSAAWRGVALAARGRARALLVEDEWLRAPGGGWDTAAVDRLLAAHAETVESFVLLMSPDAIAEPMWFPPTADGPISALKLTDVIILPCLKSVELRSLSLSLEIAGEVLAKRFAAPKLESVAISLPSCHPTRWIQTLATRFSKWLANYSADLKRLSVNAHCADEVASATLVANLLACAFVPASRLSGDASKIQRIELRGSTPNTMLYAFEQLVVRVLSSFSHGTCLDDACLMESVTQGENEPQSTLDVCSLDILAAANYDSDLDSRDRSNAAVQVRSAQRQALYTLEVASRNLETVFLEGTIAPSESLLFVHRVLPNVRFELSGIEMSMLHPAFDEIMRACSPSVEQVDLRLVADSIRVAPKEKKTLGFAFIDENNQLQISETPAPDDVYGRPSNDGSILRDARFAPDWLVGGTEHRGRNFPLRLPRLKRLGLLCVRQEHLPSLENFFERCRLPPGMTLELLFDKGSDTWHHGPEEHITNLHELEALVRVIRVINPREVVLFPAPHPRTFASFFSVIGGTEVEYLPRRATIEQLICPGIRVVLRPSSGKVRVLVSDLANESLAWAGRTDASRASGQRSWTAAVARVGLSASLPSVAAASFALSHFSFARSVGPLTVRRMLQRCFNYIGVAEVSSVFYAAEVAVEWAFPLDIFFYDRTLILDLFRALRDALEEAIKRRQRLFSRLACAFRTRPAAPALAVERSQPYRPPPPGVRLLRNPPKPPPSPTSSFQPSSGARTSLELSLDTSSLDRSSVKHAPEDGSVDRDVGGERANGAPDSSPDEGPRRRRSVQFIGMSSESPNESSNDSARSKASAPSGEKEDRFKEALRLLGHDGEGTGSSSSSSMDAGDLKNGLEKSAAAAVEAENPPASTSASGSGGEALAEDGTRPQGASDGADSAPNSNRDDSLSEPFASTIDNLSLTSSPSPEALAAEAAAAERAKRLELAHAYLYGVQGITAADVRWLNEQLSQQTQAPGSLDTEAVSQQPYAATACRFFGSEGRELRKDRTFFENEILSLVKMPLPPLPEKERHSDIFRTLQDFDLELPDANIGATLTFTVVP